MLTVRIQKQFRSSVSDFFLNTDFTLRKEDGTAVFFGASGSGKTLTFQGISGLYKPDRAFIKFRNTLFCDTEKNIFLPAQQRKISYVFQDYALFPHLTVLQNVAYAKSGLWVKFLSKSIKEECLELLKQFRIENLKNHYPSQLSGGQKQRAALARAILAKSELLFLDEPFSALDPLLRETMRRELLSNLQKTAIPAVLITHDPEDVLFFADTLIIFKDGTTQKIEHVKKQGLTEQTIKPFLLDLLK